jgi:hypothetical protein
MSDWIEQYSAALDARDAREQAHKPFIDAYTKLADRTAAAAITNTSSTPASPALLDRTATPTKAKGPAKSPVPDSDLLTTFRTDLSNTQRARASLQAQVAELTLSLNILQTSQKDSSVQITTLTKQKLDTERKLRDREEEIRGKAKLVEEAQDEMVSLQLQLNMAEQKKEELQKENGQLVERWMRRMGEEVERVNRDAGWE